MFTISYKDHYINGYCDKLECRVILPNTIKTYKSLHSAKMAITRYIKALQNCNINSLNSKV